MSLIAIIATIIGLPVVSYVIFIFVNSRRGWVISKHLHKFDIIYEAVFAETSSKVTAMYQAIMVFKSCPRLKRLTNEELERAAYIISHGDDPKLLIDSLVLQLDSESIVVALRDEEYLTRMVNRNLPKAKFEVEKDTDEPDDQYDENNHSETEEPPASDMDISIAYKILNLPYGTDLRITKKRYYSLLKIHHPDKNINYPKSYRKIAEEETKKIMKAYKTICDNFHFIKDLNPQPAQASSSIDFLTKDKKKNKIFDLLTETGGIIIFAVLIILYGLGIYHSHTNHPHDSYFYRYSPLVIIRGIEFFWHDDFAGLDWDKRLKDDGRTCIYFFNAFIQREPNLHELNRRIEKFSKEINKYPKEKLQQLKTVTQIYLNYMVTAMTDLENSFRNYEKTGILYLYRSTKRTDLENKLKKYLSKEFCEELFYIIKSLFEEIRKKLPKPEIVDIKRLNEIIKNMESYRPLKNDLKTRGIYKKLFNEDYQ